MRYVYHDGRLIEAHLKPRGPNRRSGLAAPMVISDNLDSLVNHADGQRYTSKRAFEKAVRAAGCEIIGNEKQTSKGPELTLGPVEQDIKRAIEELS